MNLGKEILNNIPSDLSDLEKARYLYLELCKRVTFNTTFQNTDVSNFAYIYNKKDDVFNINSNEVICRSWSSFYSQLLTSVGIQNRIVNRGHQFVQFIIDGKKWVADATYGSYTDLSRVKNSDETNGFGYSAYQALDNDYNFISFEKDYISLIDSIDKKIGYIGDKSKDLVELKKYLLGIKDGLYSIDNNVTNDNLNYKLDYLFSLIGKLNNGYYEAKDFVYDLEKYLFTDSELSQIGAVELKRTNKDKSVDILQCIYTKTGIPSYYLLAPNLPIRRISSTQLLSLAVKGYGMDEGKKIPGVNYPKLFVPGKIFKQSKFALLKENLFKTQDNYFEAYTSKHV